MAHGQPWQDETVQALKQGYQDEIDALCARIQELETEARRAKDALEPHYTISNNGTGIMAAYNILAAVLNNTPLEKE